jgi:RNA polymerase subunit RPABC4/transcription elongation factor Spt4
MRYCNACHRITTGEPLYCNFCGDTFDVKVCPRGHTNPRVSDVCSECGSRDLSTPAPRIGFFTRVFLHSVSVLPGIFLILISLLLLTGFIEGILKDARFAPQLLILTLLVGILWFIYIQIPPVIRNLFRSAWRKSKRRRTND